MDNILKNITIIVPVYNKELYQFKRCVKSLINQVLKDIEIILINDGSDNGCEAYCDEIACKDVRIRVIHQQNQGVSIARNTGIDNAHGKYIMFVDADDWVDTRCCLEVFDYAEKHKLDLTFWTYAKEYDNHTDIYKPYIKHELCIFDQTFLGSTCKILYKKELIGKSRFDESLVNGEDVEFNFRIFKKASTYDYIDKPYYHYVIHNESAVRKFNNEMIDNYQKTLDKIKLNCSSDQDFKVYYSFMAISYLMLLMNFVFTNEQNDTLMKKINAIKCLSIYSPFNELTKNLKYIEIPISRKAAIYFIRYKIYFGAYYVIMVKKALDNRRSRHEKKDQYHCTSI